MTSPRLPNPIGITYADDYSQVRMPSRPVAPTDTEPIVQVGTDDPVVRNAFEQYVLDHAEFGAMVAPPRDTQGFLPIPGLEDMPGADLPHGAETYAIPPEVGGLVTGRGGEAAREFMAGAPMAAIQAFQKYVDEPIGATIMSEFGTRSLYDRPELPWPTPLGPDPELGAPLAPWQDEWREQYQQQPLAARLTSEILPWVAAPATAPIRGTIAAAGKTGPIGYAGGAARTALLPFAAEEAVGAALLGGGAKALVGGARAIPKIPGAAQAAAELPFEILGRLGENLMGKVKQVHRWASQTDATRPSRRVAVEAPDPEADVAHWRTPRNVPGTESGRNWAERSVGDLREEFAARHGITDPEDVATIVRIGREPLRVMEDAANQLDQIRLRDRDLDEQIVKARSEGKSLSSLVEAKNDLVREQKDIVQKVWADLEELGVTTRGKSAEVANLHTLFGNIRKNVREAAEEAEQVVARGLLEEQTGRVEPTYFGGKKLDELSDDQRARINAAVDEDIAIRDTVNTNRWGSIFLGNHKLWDIPIRRLEFLIADAAITGRTIEDPFTRQNIPIRSVQGEEAWLNAVKREYGDGYTLVTQGADKLPKTVDEAIPMVQARIDEVRRYWDETLTQEMRLRISDNDAGLRRLKDPEIDIVDPGPGIRNAFEADGQRLFEQDGRAGVGAYRARLEQVLDEWIDFTRPSGAGKTIVPRWKAGKFKGEEIKISAELLKDIQGKAAKRNRLPGMKAAVMRYLDDIVTRQIDSGQKGGVVEIPEWMGAMDAEDSLHGLANAAYKEEFTAGIHTPEELAVQAVNERGQVPDLNVINANVERMGGTEPYTNIDDVIRAADVSNGGVFQSPTARGTGIEVINSQWVIGRPHGASDRADWQAFDFLENKFHTNAEGKVSKFRNKEKAAELLNADLLARNSKALDMRYEIVAREIDKVDVEVAEVSAILKSDDFDGGKLRDAIQDNPELLDNWVKTIFVVTRNQETNKFMIGLSDEVGAYTSPTSYANKVPVFDPDQFSDLAFYHNHIRSQVFDSEQAAWTAATNDAQHIIGDGVRPTPRMLENVRYINAQTPGEPQLERVIREGLRDWLKTRDAVTAVEESERAAKEIVYQFEERGGVGQFMSKPGSNEPIQYKSEKAAKNFLTSLAIEQSDQGIRWRPYAGIDNGKPMTETEAIQRTGDTVADEIGARNNESDHTPGETHTISGLTDERVVNPTVSGPAIANSISWPHTAIDGQLHIETSAIMRLGDTDYVVTDVPNWGIQAYARIGLDAERAWVPIEGIRLDPNTGQADVARSRFIDMSLEEAEWELQYATLEEEIEGIYYGMGNPDLETISRRLTAGLEDAQGEHWSLEDWQGLNEWFGTPHATGFSKASAARAMETPAPTVPQGGVIPWDTPNMGMGRPKSPPGPPTEVEVFHGTDSPAGKIQGLPDLREGTEWTFGGVHFGTRKAATDRLGTYDKGGVQPDPTKWRVVPVEIRLEKPYGSIDNPIDETEIYGMNLRIHFKEDLDAGIPLAETRKHRTGFQQLKDEGHDGIIYRNISEDPDSISYLVFDPVKSVLPKIVGDDAQALRRLLDSDPDLEVYTKNVSRENKAGGPRTKGVQVRVRSKEGVALDPTVAKYTTRNTYGPTFTGEDAMLDALAWADEVRYGHRSRAPGHVPPEDPTDMLSAEKVLEPDEAPKPETPTKKSTKKLHKVKKVEADAAAAGGDGGGRYVKELALEIADDDNPVAKLAKVINHYDPLVARASEKVHAARQQISAEIMGQIESTELSKILHGSNNGTETGIYTQEAKNIANNMMGKLRVRQISDPLSTEYRSELIAKLVDTGGDPDLALKGNPLVEFSRKDVEDLYKGVHDWIKGKGRGRPITGANAVLSIDQIMRGDLPYASNLRILDDIFDLKKKYGVSLEESAKGYMNKSGTTAARFWENFLDFLSMPKAIVSSLDFSAPLRQAVILGPTHPVEFFRNIPKGLRLLLHPTKSRQYSELVDDYVTGRSGERPYANFLQEHGLYIADKNAGMSGREESFVSTMFERIDALKDDMNWIKKSLGYALAIPNQVVLRSERGFTGYLNLVRADVTDTIMDNWIKAGKLHKDVSGGLRYGQGVTRRDMQELTLFINRITGRGGLGPMENIPGATKFLNAAFFSPRFVSARITAPLSILTPRGMAYQKFNFFGAQGRIPLGPKVTLDDFNVLFPRTVRAQAIRDLSTFVATGSTILYLLSLQDNVTVELDPRSPDFGKGRIGALRFDFWGGHQTVVRYAAQFISGQAKNSDDKVLDRHRASIAGRSVQSKLSPFAGFVNDVWRGTTFTGDVMSLEPGSIKKQAWNRLGPLVAQDINDAFRDSFGLGLLATAIAPLGVSVTVYNGLNEIGLNLAKVLRNPASGKTWMDETKDRLRNNTKDVNVTDMNQLYPDAVKAIKDTDEYRAAQDEAYFKAAAKRPEGAELVYQNLGEIREASRSTYNSIEQAMNGQADPDGIIPINWASDSQMRTMVKGALGDLGAMSRLMEESVDFEDILGRREEQAWDVIANLYWNTEPKTLANGELDFRGQKISRLGLQNEVNSTHGDDDWIGPGPVIWTADQAEGRPIHVWDYIKGEFEDGTRVPSKYTHLGTRIDRVKYPKASIFLERMRDAEAIYEQAWWGVPDDVLSRLVGSLDQPGTPAYNYYQYLQAGPQAQQVLKNAKGVPEAIEIVGLIREKNRRNIEPVFEGQTLEQMSMTWGFGLSSAKTIPGEATRRDIIQAWSPANAPEIPTLSNTPGLEDLMAPIGSTR